MKPASLARALAAETVGTFALVFAGAGAIGGTVALDADVGGPVTGTSMNPARSIGPALAAVELSGLVYQLVRGEHPEPAG